MRRIDGDMLMKKIDGLLKEHSNSVEKWLANQIHIAVNEAPTMVSEIPTGSDLIRRQDALKPFCIAPDGTRIPEVDCDNFPVEFSVEFIKKHLLSLPSADGPTGECKTCKRSSDYRWSIGENDTRCPIEEHYALPKDGYCHLYEQI